MHAMPRVGTRAVLRCEQCRTHTPRGCLCLTTAHLPHAVIVRAHVRVRALLCCLPCPHVLQGCQRIISVGSAADAIVVRRA